MKLVNLTSRLNSEGNFLNAAALFDVLLLALLFFGLSSKFVLATGMGVELPELEGVEESSADFALVDADLTVLNAQSKNMLIYDGEILTPETFKNKMLAESRKRKSGTLLVKADKSVDAQMLLDICQVAKTGGFKRIQLAAKNPNTKKL